MNASRASLLCFVLAAALVGCGAHYVNRGADLYAGGHYIEAAEVFERTESRLEQSSSGERARYGLYRGATLLALGDRPRAQHWLRYSDTQRAALSSEERLMLGRALGVVAQRRPAGLPAADGGAVATSQSVPDASPSAGHEAPPALVPAPN